MSVEAELLNAIRNALAKVNERERSNFTFVHGTRDGVNEGRAEEWNASNSSQRAVGEISGRSFGEDRIVATFLFQQAKGEGVEFQLLEQFDDPILFPEIATEQFNFLNDLSDGVQLTTLPHYENGVPRLLMGGLMAHGLIDDAGFGLWDALQHLSMSRHNVRSRAKGLGNDIWSTSVNQMVDHGGPEYGHIQTPECGLTPMLEALLAAGTQMPWQVVVCTSISSLFVYERENRAAIIRLVKEQREGYVTAMMTVDAANGERIHGCLIRNMADLSEAATRVERLYRELRNGDSRETL